MRRRRALSKGGMRRLLVGAVLLVAGGRGGVHLGSQRPRPEREPLFPGDSARRAPQ